MTSADSDIDLDVVKKFRLLFVENDVEVIGEAERRLAEFPDVKMVPVATQDAAMDAIAGGYVDAAIVDIELEVRGAGFEVLRQLARRARGTPSVIATRHFDLETTTRLIALVGTTGLHGIIDKRDPPVDWIANSIAGPLADWRERDIEIRGLETAVELVLDRAERNSDLRSDASEVATEIERLCRALFGRAQIVKGESVQRVELQPMDGEGFSPAITVEAHVVLGKDASGKEVPGNKCVLKIGPVEGIGIEAERYAQFVRYGVRLAHRVELLGHASAHSLGAVCYSFAGGVFGDDLVNLNELLKVPSYDQLAIDAIGQLFDTTKKNWYAVNASPRALQQYFREDHDMKPLQCSERLDKSLNNLDRRFSSVQSYSSAGPESEGAFQIGPRTLRIPPQEFLGRGVFVVGVHSCLVHGDMHGGNVMVELAYGDGAPAIGGNGHEPSGAARVERLCLIDYRSAGPGPRCVDAAALETSIRVADAKRIEREADVHEAKGQKELEAAIEAAVNLAAGRYDGELAVAVEAWGVDVGTAPAAAKTESDRAWRARSTTLALGLRENFGDELDGVPPVGPKEYFATCLTMALKQMYYDSKPVLRVRLLAWLSAQYKLLKDQMD